MQRPCERENRAGTSIETRANVSMRRNIAHITSNRNDLQKKKKKENRIPLAVCVSLKFDRCPARNQSPREISKRGPACLYLHVKGSQEPSPLLSEGSKEFVDCTRVICASTSTKWLSQPFFQASRVSPSVRSPPSIFPFRGRRGEESFPSEGAVSSTGVCDARREPRPLLSRKRLEIVFRRRQGSNNWSDRKGKGPISNDHPRGNLTFVSSGSIVLLPLDTQTGWLCTLFEQTRLDVSPPCEGENEERAGFFRGLERDLLLTKQATLSLTTSPSMDDSLFKIQMKKKYVGRERRGKAGEGDRVIPSIDLSPFPLLLSSRWKTWGRRSRWELLWKFIFISSFHLSSIGP